MANSPQLLYVAGPNGAGKSTFSKELSEPGAIIFDVDNVIARIEAQSPLIPKRQVYDAATQEFFYQANEATRLQQHFTLETNFRDKELVDIAAQFKRHGYTTNIVYLTLESIEESISRVKERVLDGGHFVVAYANAQKNGSLEERIEMEALLTETKRTDNKSSLNNESAEKRLFAKYQPEYFATPISIDIRNDVDDQAVHGRKRRRKKPGYGR